jgi:outer membrane protein OmpA-like peptidoglycan-associated protein
MKEGKAAAACLMFGCGQASILSYLCAIVITLVGAPNAATAVAWRWPYYCFFDLASTNLTDRCRQIIGEAVASWHRERDGRQYKSDVINPREPYAPPYTAHLRVLGFAPDADAPAAAAQLSVGRAAGVAAELKRLGIPDDLITVEGFGNKAPLVPNAPADPQNRLVSIEFR